MPDAPLSRRERRALEAQAAERAAAQEESAHSLAQGAPTGEIPAVNAAPPVLSRRDRRRLERLARPMESWTAEEEMIATGQIPAMTPERIAEQERLAREAAERAAADAQTASAELRILGQRSIDPDLPVEPAAPSEHPDGGSSGEVPLVQPAPSADAEVPLEDRRIVEPYSPRFEFDGKPEEMAAAESEPVELPTGFDPDAKIERTPAPTGEPDSDDVEGLPATWPESFEGIFSQSYEAAPPSSDEPPAATPSGVELSAIESLAAESRAAESRAAEAPASHSQAAESQTAQSQTAEAPASDSQTAESLPAESQTPESLPAESPVADEIPDAAESFGARQEGDGESEAEILAARARVFEELFNPEYLKPGSRERARRTPAPATPEAVQGDDEEAARQRGIEEFRRLTEAAISGIERNAQPEPESADTESPEPESVEPESVEPESVAPEPAEPESANRYEMPAESADAQESPDADAEGSPDADASMSPPEQENQATPPTPSEGFASHQATFEEPARTPSTEIPLRPVNQPEPKQGQSPAQWANHPLDAAAATAVSDVNDFQPVSNSPRPDFSQLYTRPQQVQFPATGVQSEPTSGQIPTTSGQFPIYPSATGQSSSVTRNPDLPPVGGAKHFKWLHLAVIGALMFLLGVVIYNVAFGQ